MIAYWAVFLGAVLLALSKLRISQLGWGVIGAVLVAFIGLRYRVGGDWFNYLGYLYRVTGEPLHQVLALSDPGYQLLNWVSATLGFDIWFVNLVAAITFVYGLLRFVRALPDPRIALAVSIPYLVTVMAMGYTRQAMAFGFVLWGITYLVERRLLRFALLLAVGATFHKSAVILIPLAALANTRNRVWSIVWVGFIGLVLYTILLQDAVDNLYQNYVVASYANAAEGGPVRVLMNAFPAVAFLIFRRRFDISEEERALWFWVSLLCLCCVPLLAVSATAVDRVALYLTPIQLVVASHFSRAFQRDGQVFARAAVLSLYGAVMFVWLNYASNRSAWLPYQFWPLA